jgi:hypothetical protein
VEGGWKESNGGWDGGGTEGKFVFIYLFHFKLFESRICSWLLRIVWFGVLGLCDHAHGMAWHGMTAGERAIRGQNPKSQLSRPTRPRPVNDDGPLSAG